MECKDCFYYGTTKDGSIGCSNPQCTHTDEDSTRCTEFVLLRTRRTIE